MKRRLLAAILAGVVTAVAAVGMAAADANPNASCAGAMASQQSTPGDASGAWSRAASETKVRFAHLGNRENPGETDGGMSEAGFGCGVSH